MNHDLALALELLEQEEWGLRFRLAARNESSVNLLLPDPDVTGLRFVRASGGPASEWYTSLLVSTAGGWVILPPDGAEAYAWKVRPCSVPRPDTWGDDYNYYRWCVALPPGVYQVWYEWVVDGGYFDPDSHARLADLEYIAGREGAVVWQGRAASNRVRLTFP